MPGGQPAASGRTAVAATLVVSITTAQPRRTDMHPHIFPEYRDAHRADLVRDAEAYRAAAAHRPRRPRRRLRIRRRPA
jgi:hypothetical protein